VDFGALPPEVNSGRMYLGAGSGPWLAAGAAWDGLASELSSAATAYQSTVSELTAAWLGPSSRSMAAAVAPYVTWMNTTAAQAEQTASQARAAAAAYEAAFAATVPPPLIAANRALLMSLVATNIVGQNTPAIAATEAQYTEMWAQDAAAMYGYAGASASATRLTPFTSPSPDTNPAGAGAQTSAAASASGTSAGTAQSTLSSLISQVPGTLQSLASGASINPTNAVTNLLTSPLSEAVQPFVASVASASTLMYSPLYVLGEASYMCTPLMSIHPAGAAVAASAAPAAGAVHVAAVSGASEGGVDAGVAAGLGRAASVGGLSVPQSWATASPAIRLASSALPIAGFDGLPGAGPGNLFGGLPAVGSVVNAPRNSAAGPHASSRLKVIPETAAAPGVHESTPARAMTRSAGTADVARTSDVLDELSASERAELDQLRKDLADMALERDAAARSIREAVRR
jgi:PPE-repeat protein